MGRSESDDTKPMSNKLRESFIPVEKYIKKLSFETQILSQKAIILIGLFIRH